MLFFLCFSSLFFHRTYAGMRKKNKMPKEKKKKTLAQCPRLPDRQMTYRTYCVERSHSFVYVFPNNDRLTEQLPVATKVWLFLVLDLSSRAKNVLESLTETFKQDLITISRVYVRWFQQTGSWLLVFSDQTVKLACFRLILARGRWGVFKALANVHEWRASCFLE